MELEYQMSSDWPPDDADLAASLGRLLIAWSILETEIDHAIADIYRLHENLDLALCITSNLGTKAKLEIFQSSSYCMSEYLSPVTTKEIDDLVNDTASASNGHRNFVAHGRPSYLDLGGKDDTWIWTRPSARKGGPKLRIVQFKAAYFDNATDEIKQLYSRWDHLRGTMQKGLEALDRDRRL